MRITQGLVDTVKEYRMTTWEGVDISVKFFLPDMVSERAVQLVFHTTPSFLLKAESGMLGEDVQYTVSHDGWDKRNRDSFYAVLGSDVRFSNSPAELSNFDIPKGEMEDFGEFIKTQILPQAKGIVDENEINRLRHEYPAKVMPPGWAGWKDLPNQRIVVVDTGMPFFKMRSAFLGEYWVYHCKNSTPVRFAESYQHLRVNKEVIEYILKCL